MNSITINNKNVKTTTLKYLLMVFALIIGNRGLAQTYDVYVANRALTTDTTMEFDVFIKSNGATGTWQLRTYQCGYQFASGFVNGGTLKGAYILGSSALEATFGKTWGFTWNAANRVLNQSANTGGGCPGAPIGTTPRKIGRFKVTNSVAWGCADDGLTMRTSGSGFLILAVTKWNDASCTDGTGSTVTAGATSSVTGASTVLTASASAPATANCGGTVSVVVSNTGGVSPFTGVGTFERGSGSWNFTVTDGRGCTSSASAVIGVGATSVSATSNVTVCSGSLPYVFGGNNLTASGTYVDTFQTAGGCDSIVTLNLTVTNATSATQNLAICNTALPYPWNGQSLTASGTYTATLTNAANCDSVVTLNLTVSTAIPAVPGVITQTLIDNNCGARVYRYSVPAVANATGYNWTLPTSVGGVSGVTVDSGDITKDRVIRVIYASNNAALTTDVIAVRAYSGCGTSANRSASLTNKAWVAPVAGPVVKGTTVVGNVCNARRVRYTVPTPAAATYGTAVGFEWSFVGDVLGANASIDSGTSTSQTIVVLYTNNAAAAANDSVRCRYNFNNGCVYSPQGRLKISLLALTSPAAPTITATNLVTNVCNVRKVRYSVGSLPSATPSRGAATGFEWELVGTGLSANYTVDSGSLTSQSVIIMYTSNAAAAASDSVKCRYTSDCGPGAWRAFKNALKVLNGPAAPVITATNLVTNVCNARKVRYSVGNLPAATAANGAATGFEWELKGTGLSANYVVDSGSLTSQSVIIMYTSNEAANSSDSVKARYTSDCGPGAWKAFKNALAKLNGPAAPTTITIQKIADAECGLPRYRFIAPSPLPAATATNGAATGYDWTFTGTNLGSDYTIDSGDVNSQKITVQFGNALAAAATDSVKLRYNSECGYGSWRATKLAMTAYTTNPPAAPASIKITQVSDVCGARQYRYEAPALTAATATASAATGWDWTFVGSLYAAGATIDSGSLSSQKLLVTFASNAAALTGDSAKVRYTSLCGNGLWRALKLNNIAKTGCTAGPVARVPQPSASMEAMAYPNPTTNSFKLRVSASNRDQAVQVRILDLQGRVFKMTRMMPGETLTLGAELKAGTYIVETRQGKQTKLTRVIKL